MSESNTIINRCLDKLYDVSGNFKVSIDIIQKLAQHLRLETFIDKHAYTMNPNPLHQQLKPQRLSIAGSLILLDIDFTEGDKIISLLLSLANHAKEDEQKSQDTEIEEVVVNDINVVKIDLMNNATISLLKKKPGEEFSTAESILFANLQEPRLNKFPENLAYLANLERLSSGDLNLFTTIDSLALLLKTIQSYEKAKDDDWEKQRGFTNSIGNVVANEKTDSQIGLFLEYWCDSRYLNRESEIKGRSDVYGKNYNVLITVEENPDEEINYFRYNEDEIWKLLNAQGEVEKFQFTSKTGKDRKDSATNWLLKLKFNEPILLPDTLLDFLGLDYEVSGQRQCNKEYEILNSGKDLKFTNNIGSQVDIVLCSQLVSDFVPVQKITLRRLIEIKQLIPIFRNSLVMTNLIRNLSANRHDDVVKPQEETNNKNDLSQEVKKKLKESLKLPDNVTDEELLTLSTSADGLKNTAPDLETFMNDESDEEEQEKKNTINLSLNSLDFQEEFKSLQFSVSGAVGSTSISTNFKILNGIISGNTLDDAMEVDGASEKFVKALHLTEDIVACIKYIT